MGTARILFFALKRLISRASRRAFTRTSLPVSVFVLDPDPKVSNAGFPDLVFVVLVLPPSTRMPPILGSRGTVLESTTFDVCFALSLWIPSMAALSISASFSTSC